jgi:hypothetical protein
MGAWEPVLGLAMLLLAASFAAAGVTIAATIVGARADDGGTSLSCSGRMRA